MLYGEGVANETLTALLKLRAVRESLGVTQAELARRMGLTQARVSAIERTDPIRLTVETLNSYADALGGNLVIGVAIEGVGASEIWRGDSDTHHRAEARREHVLDAGYARLASEFNSEPAHVERRTARDRYTRRTEAHL